MKNSSQRHIRWAVVILCLLYAAVATHAETLLLRDGSKITGAITSQTETSVIIKTSYGTLTIDKANIANIDYGTGGTLQQQQPQQQQQDSPSGVDYSRGRADGEQKGYEDGKQKGRAEQKSARVNGSLVGWLVWVVVLGVVLIAAS